MGITWRKPLSHEIKRCDYGQEVYIWNNYMLVKFPDSFQTKGKWGLFTPSNELIDKVASISPPYQWAKDKILKGMK